MNRLQKTHRRNFLHRMTRPQSSHLLNFRHRLILHLKYHLHLNRLLMTLHCCLLTNQRLSFQVCFGRNCRVALNCFQVCCWPSFPAWCCCCYSRSTRC